MFAAFILASGTTYAMPAWNIWHSTYRLKGVLKANTATLSIATAIVTIKLAPACAGEGCAGGAGARERVFARGD